MSLNDALIKEIEPVAEYFAMLYEYSKTPVAFNFTAKNGKKYILVAQEAREEKEEQPQASAPEPVVEQDSEIVE